MCLPYQLLLFLQEWGEQECYWGVGGTTSLVLWAWCYEAQLLAQALTREQHKKIGGAIRPVFEFSVKSIVHYVERCGGC